MKAFHLSVLSFLLMTSVASAREGGGSTGGGAAVVCWKGKRIQSVRLLDLYQAPTGDSPYHFVRSETTSAEDQFAEVLKKLTPSLSRDLRKARGEITIDRLPKNVKMSQPYDLGDNPVLIEDRCTTEWTAFYGADNHLKIVTKFFDRMSKTDQAALLLHETAYRLFRIRNHETTSEDTRAFVALAFSEEATVEALQKISAPIDFDQSMVRLTDHFQDTYTLTVVGKNVSAKAHKIQVRLVCGSDALELNQANGWGYIELVWSGETPDPTIPANSEQTREYQVSGECGFVEVRAIDSQTYNGEWAELQVSWELRNSRGELVGAHAYEPKDASYGFDTSTYRIYPR